MKAFGKLAVTVALCFGSVACVNLTPEESCKAICSELQACQLAITGSSLSADASCESDCLSQLQAHGDGCKSSAANLGDCFQTYTCEGDDFGCSDEARSFSEDCR